MYQTMFVFVLVAGVFAANIPLEFSSGVNPMNDYCDKDSVQNTVSVRPIRFDWPNKSMNRMRAWFLFTELEINP